LEWEKNCKITGVKLQYKKKKNEFKLQILLKKGGDGRKNVKSEI
jgi:hypothetical protein